jgi:hypothetical protein
MRLMPAIFGLGLSIAVLITPRAGWAQEADIRGVIDAQITAFLADDFAAAFEFAAPGIRRIFRSAENFGLMVREGYPMVHRPGRVRYLDLEPAGADRLQRVLIEDRSGARHVLEYRMELVNGAWRIAGVRILQAPGESV